MADGSVAGVASLKGKVSAEEWQARVDLAALYRLVALYGWDDLIFTHLSVRVPGPEHHFLINPYNLMFEEITASSLVKIDVDGKPVMETPYLTNPAGFTIHSALHMNREDANAVMHLHTPHGQAVAAQEFGLLPLTQTAMLVREEIAYHDYEGVATDLDERERLVADLGDKQVLILKSHGLLTAGTTIQEAFQMMSYLEQSCRIQLDVMASGGRKIVVGGQVAEKVARQYEAGSHGQREWPALLRILDRVNPGYDA